SLYPDVLDAGEIGCLINRGDKHPRGERLVVAIPLPVEVGKHHCRIVIGGCGLESLTTTACAFEGGRREKLRRIPANTFASLAAIERSLVNILKTSEPTTRLQ